MNPANTTAIDACAQLDEPTNNLMSIAIQCSDELFDWLSLKELAALNNTCKKLQELTSDYVQRKYPMKCMKVGQVHSTKDVLYWSKDKSMQAFTKNVRNLVVVPSTDCLRYLDAVHSKNIVSLAFYDGQIMEEDAVYLASLMKNVEIVEVQYGSIGGELYENVLKYCGRMKQLVIKYGFDECENSGAINQWMHKTFPTLEHFHWSATPLPENLEIFFRQNPNIQSFNSGVYTTMNVIEFLLRTATTIKQLHFELILELHEDESEGMAMLQSNLNTLHERGQFKDLMLEFMFRTHLLDKGWTKLAFLTGAYIDFPQQPGSTKALSSLVHLKLLVLGINTILSPAKANTLSKKLRDLEEIYIQIDSLHAIVPFARHSAKLHKIYVYRMGHGRGFNTKKIKHHSIRSLNECRSNLMDARKLIIHLPDQAYVQIKCQTNDCLNQSLIEIKRSESHVLMHPFAATKIRKDICELYEKF